MITPEQTVGIVVSALIVLYVLWDGGTISLPSFPSSPKPAPPGVDSVASDVLALSSKLRALGCQEGVAACQTLLNIVMAHPNHSNEVAK